MSDPERSRAVLVNVVLGLVYLALGWGTLALGEAGGVEPRRLVWVGSGIALSVALLVPFRVWPGVAVAGGAVTLLSGDPLPHALVTGMANGFEIALPVHLLRRRRFDPSLERVRDVLLLVGAAGVASFLAAAASVGSLVLNELAPPSAFGPIVLRWWATHGVAMLAIAPPVLALRSATAWPAAYRVELVSVLAALALTGGLTFTAPPGSLTARLFFLSFPFLVWCAVRLGMAGATLGATLATALVLWGAERGRGPLVADTDAATLLLTWTFANAVILTTLVAAALLSEARRARAALLQGKRRLEAVLNATRDAVLVSDPDGTVIETNPGLLALLGATEPLVGRPVREVLDRLASRTRPDVAVPGWLTDPEPARETAEGFLAFADGTGWEIRTAPMRSGQVSGRVWSLHDVTERLRSEEERAHLQRQVLHAQKLEGLGLLAGGVAHDFNNLLSVIMGHAELIAADAGDGEVRQDARGILAASEHAAALCRQMLTYSGQGQPDRARGPVDLAVLARDLHRLLRTSMPPDAELVLEAAGGPTTVHGDETRLRQVVMNLVTNASDAVAASGRGGRIVVRTGSARLDRDWLRRTLVDDGLEPGEYVVLSVQDDGVGMDEETASQIFDPFFSSKGPGRGLGLATTLGVIRSHGGGIRLDTTPGGGSLFRIALPHLDDVPEPADEPPAARRPARDRPPSPPPAG